MRRRAALGVLVVSFLSAGLAGRIAEANELILVDETAPPLMYATPQGPAGVCPAVLREISSRLGDAITIEAAPWKRILAQADGAAAGVACMRETRERDALFDFSDPIFPVSFGVHARRGRMVEYHGLASLRGRLIGVRRGWSYGEDFDRSRGEGLFRIEESDGDGQTLEKLLEGRIDVAILAQPTADMLLSALDTGDRIASFRDDSLTGDTHIAFPKRSGKAALIRRINDALGAMRADGTLQKLNTVVSRP